MSAVSPAQGSAHAPGLAPAGAHDRGVPARARELAARLSALFERDVEIVKRLNDAQHRLQEANERLWSGLAPDAFGLIYDGAAAAAIGTARSPRSSATTGPLPTARCLRACRPPTGRFTGRFAANQFACEERRQLAVEVGELSQQLTDALGAAGWSALEAQQANVHELARAAA